MKLLIRLIISIGFPIYSFAGVSGSGGGPRPGMNILTVAPGAEIALAGGSGGGTGPRPQYQTDFVKAEKIDKNTITFKYRPYDQANIQIHKIQTTELKDSFREALEKSIQSRNWEEVQIEE